MKKDIRAWLPWAVMVGLLCAGQALAREDCASLAAPAGAASVLPPGSPDSEQALRDSLGVPAGGCAAKAVFGNLVYVAFRSEPGDQLAVRTSADGIHFKPARTYALKLGSDPALAVFHNQLYVAFRSNDAGQRLVLTSSKDGKNFVSPAREYDDLRLGSDPALAVFDNQLFIAYRSPDAQHGLALASTFDGVDFFCPTTRVYTDYRPTSCQVRVYSGLRLGSSPALRVDGGRLTVLFESDGPGRERLVTSSTNGVDFAPPAPVPGAPVARAPSVGAWSPNAPGFQVNTRG